MAKRILLDDYVEKKLNECRKLRERYEELSGITRRHEKSDSDLVWLAIIDETEHLKGMIEFYEWKKAEVNNG